MEKGQIINYVNYITIYNYKFCFQSAKKCILYMVLGTHTDQEVDVFCFCPFGMFGSFSSQTFELEEGNK